MKDSILERIKMYQKQFSGKQKILANYILENYQTASFLNSTNLAKAAGVSGSTVIRFADELGYDGFPKMKAAMYQLIQQDINTVDAFITNEKNNHKIEDKQEKGIFSPCIRSFHKIEQALDVTQLDQLAKFLSEADHLYIVGFQGSEFLAVYMSYYLSKVRKNVHRIVKLDSTLFEALSTGQEMKKNAALIYAFPRYPVQTIKTAKYLQAQGIPIACMTTPDNNPISELADLVIPFDIDYHSYIDHLAPVVYISELIGKKMANMQKDASIKQLEAFEKYAKITHLFISNLE